MNEIDTRHEIITDEDLRECSGGVGRSYPDPTGG